ncbi:MAG: bifunctional folylpolyglutamate synthase/dihydrofolate synthase [Planctomycetota bacterium]|nr:MAG: bifunctional folylpolyglutamate synthase/dihydrofolate synthase [Planctomycetota bacterium]
MIDTYEQAIEFLYRRINYERASASQYALADFKLERMQRLLDAIGRPHASLPAIHIAGTKGKGSTAAMAANILQTSGHRVGLFTSPHVEHFEERLQLDGRPVDRATLVRLVDRLARTVCTPGRFAPGLEPTFFELTTALAWMFFAEAGADLVVLEVGLGGRLDATNVCRPIATAITAISRDHTQVLGTTLREIAREKAGIIKRRVPIVCGAVQPDVLAVVRDVARDRQAPLYEHGRDFDAVRSDRRDFGDLMERVAIRTPWSRFDDLSLGLAGPHQHLNAAIAVMLASLADRAGFRVSEHAVHHALAATHFPVRCEIVARRPLVVLDAAHNWASARALLDFVRSLHTVRRRLLLFASTRDKDVAGLLRCLLPVFDITVLTRYAGNPRAMPLGDLYDIATSVTCRPVHLAEDPTAAWRMASTLAGPDDLICVAGSFFIAGEVRQLLRDGRPCPSDGPRTDRVPQ